MLVRPKTKRTLLWVCNKGPNQTQRIQDTKNLHSKQSSLPSLAHITLNKRWIHSNRFKQPTQHQMRKPINLNQKQNKPKAPPNPMVKPKPEVIASPAIAHNKPITFLSDFTMKEIHDNGAEIDKEYNSHLKAIPTYNCLEEHNISALLRAKMVNWMVEVMNVFECEEIGRAHV